MINLSDLGFPMLYALTQLKGKYMSYEEAQSYDQRPFRSMLIRGWVKWSRKEHGFYLTKEGEEAWMKFNSRDISRKNPHLPLTAFFNAEAYGLAGPKEKSMRGAA